MKHIALAIAAAGILSACAPPPPNACGQTMTWADRFGTPEDKGPCWGEIISQVQNGNIRSYMMRMPVPGYVIADITYQGDTLIQAGMTRVR